MKKKPKVLLIGWDAADWKFLNPLIDQGLMPTLQKLVEGGAMGRMATLDPPLSPTLWTSIATGKRPYDHGIHGFTEPDFSGESVRPIYSTNRKVKAIWNILTQEKKKTHVVGWWPSHPAEPINGVMVSNFFQRAHKDIKAPWPLPKGTVHPAEQQDLYAKLRVHPQELTGAHIQPFLPLLPEIDQANDKRVYGVAQTLADCTSIHSAATYILENEDWDFMAVYYDAIDHFCHGYMAYHPPRRPHIPERDYELYKDVVAAGCRYHDMMLERLLQLAGPDTTVMLISDHGFHPDHNRPLAIPKEPAGPAIEHSNYGIVVMNGPGIKKDSNIFGASLLDVAPTLLHLFDLPVGRDMEGRVLTQAFEDPGEIEAIDSWEDIAGEDGSHPKSIEIDAAEARQELQQLIELGYVEDPGDNGQEAVRKTIAENNYNLARAYINGSKWLEALPILENLWAENPEATRYAVHLINTYQQAGQYLKARAVIDTLRQSEKRQNSQLDIIEGMQLLAEHRVKKALELFKKVEQEAGDVPNLQLRIANAYLQLSQLEAAEAAVERAIRSNPENETAHLTLGMIRKRNNRLESALEAFMDAVGLLYFQPMAHYQIGDTLRRLELHEEAIAAFEVCLKLAPKFNKARKQLIEILEGPLQQPGRAIKYKADYEQKLQGTITIVSGLPRSGTSMLMQMLEAGGLEIFTDQERNADENNPKGYYEHQAVKALKRNASFLKDADGKVVKVIAQLLPTLPTRYRYRVIFLERDLLEVIGSQQKMLIRSGKTDSETLPLNLIKEYENAIRKAKEWAAQQLSVEFLVVQHRDIIEGPLLQAIQLNDFLDGNLAVEKMAGVVDKDLYRERSASA